MSFMCVLKHLGGLGLRNLYDGDAKQNIRGANLTMCCIQIYGFLTVNGYVIGSVFSFIDTLLTPILSDNFGFTIEDTSYFFLISMFLPLIASILL